MGTMLTGGVHWNFANTRKRRIITGPGILRQHQDRLTSKPAPLQALALPETSALHSDSGAFQLRKSCDLRRKYPLHIHNIQITTTMFVMYFIHNFLINMFRSLLRPSSGWCYFYKNTKVHLWLVVSPSFHNN